MLGKVGSHSSLRVKGKLMGTGGTAVFFLGDVFTDNLPVNNLPLLLVQASLIKLDGSKIKEHIRVENEMLGGSVPSGRGVCAGE